MSRRGTEYLHSNEKRLFDLCVARTSKPVEALSRAALALSVQQPADRMTFEQLRVGTDDQPFMMTKLRTLKSNGAEMNALARVYRKIGLDELAQFQCVIDGDMSIFGRRPLIPEEHFAMFEDLPDTREVAKLLKRHDTIVKTAKPGIISSFALRAHQGIDFGPIDRLRADVCDHENASMSYDLRILAKGVMSLVRGELIQNTVPPFGDQSKNSSTY